MASHCDAAITALSLDHATAAVCASRSISQNQHGFNLTKGGATIRRSL